MPRLSRRRGGVEWEGASGVRGCVPDGAGARPPPGSSDRRRSTAAGQNLAVASSAPMDAPLSVAGLGLQRGHALGLAELQKTQGLLAVLQELAQV